MWIKRIGIVMFGLCWPLVLSAQDPAKQDKKDAEVKEIDLKGAKLKPVRGGLKDPTVITSAEELAKQFEDNALQGQILKQVDLAKQKLLYFAWSGSGGDKITFEVGKGDKAPEVIFRYKPGLTRDLRPHFHLFAVPKDATSRIDRKG